MYEELLVPPSEEDIKEIIRDTVGACHIVYKWKEHSSDTVSLHILVQYDKNDGKYTGICLDNLNTNWVGASGGLIGTAKSPLLLLCHFALIFFDEQLDSVCEAAERGDETVSQALDLLMMQAHPLLWAEYHRIERQSVIGDPLRRFGDVKVFETFRLRREGDGHEQY